MGEIRKMFCDRKNTKRHELPRKEGRGVTGGAFHCAVPENIHTPPTEGF